MLRGHLFALYENQWVFNPSGLPFRLHVTTPDVETLGLMETAAGESEEEDVV